MLYTGKQLQLVLMSLQPGEDIGEEVHPDRDQFFRVEKGKGEVWITLYAPARARGRRAVAASCRFAVP